ncbi:MAG: AAA family ATPase [Oscillospiraceae bacterium]|jgi:DNA repair exonuclease SbcCD ATPase subunit|nr:AAA family ATPase [Oscillospiraceae bacterium]
MKILEMTATFGKLHKATLRPGPGLTLIMAPNEGGKSTWAAFLRAMLYGFPQRDRDKAGYLAEKNRYQPWSGAAMEGSLTLEWQGRSLTLRRGPKGTAAWGTFSAVWTATGEPVPGLTGENCGETLLGVSREVFERTAFVGQGEIALSPSGDLEKRVAALATSGEEDVSYSQVERRLKDWLNRRRVNVRVGLIPELEGELASVEEALSRQGSLLRQTQEARQEKEALETQRADLEARLQAHAAASAAQQSERRQQAQVDYDAAFAELQGLERAARALPPTEKLRQAQGDLAYLNTLTANLKLAEKAIPEAREKMEWAEKAVDFAQWFKGLDPYQANAQAQKDHQAASRGDPTRLMILLAALNAILYGFTAYRWWFQGELSSMLLAVLCSACWLWMFFFRRKLQRERQAILERYKVDQPEDILKRAAVFQRDYAAALEAHQAYQAVAKERDKLAAQREELTTQLLEFVHPFAPEVTDLFGVSAALSRALQQGERLALAKAKAEAAERLLSALPSPGAGQAQPLLIPTPQGDPAQLSAQLGEVNTELRRSSDTAARLEGELRSLGDPAELEARRGQLLEQLELRRGEYEAIAAAMESLKNADSLLRERFSPAVNERAGHYLSLLTGGRYDKASLTRQFQALAQEAGETAPRQDLSLSGGAAQQLYLAVRLAMCDMALPQGDPCPILLDDALDAFDDERTRLALECLLETAKTRQVLLFTCHSRERSLVKDENVTVWEG